MLEFALHPGECTKINQVAERQQISDKYLEQIVTILSRAGYVKSMRGAQGGYYLTKEPSDYTVGMIPVSYTHLRLLIFDSLPRRNPLIVRMLHLSDLRHVIRQ